MLRDERLHVRLAKSVKRLAEKRAEALGFSLSEYVRYLIILGDAIHIEKRKP